MTDSELLQSIADQLQVLNNEMYSYHEYEKQRDLDADQRVDASEEVIPVPDYSELLVSIQTSVDSINTVVNTPEEVVAPAEQVDYTETLTSMQSSIDDLTDTTYILCGFGFLLAIMLGLIFGSRVASYIFNR